MVRLPAEIRKYSVLVILVRIDSGTKDGSGSWESPRANNQAEVTPAAILPDGNFIGSCSTVGANSVSVAIFPPIIELACLLAGLRLSDEVRHSEGET